MGRIVVGIDRSEEAAAALRWAYDEARLRRATLEVVHAWTGPDASRPASRPAVSLGALKRAASHRLTSVVEETIGPHPEIPVIQTLVNRDPAEALLEDADHAELLVVGTRCQSALNGFFLGSVSQRCLTHAPCPVAVIRPPVTASN